VSYSYFGLIEEVATESLKQLIKSKKSAGTKFEEGEIISLIQNVGFLE
jgi:hypothetical protein